MKINLLALATLTCLLTPSLSATAQAETAPAAPEPSQRCILASEVIAAQNVWGDAIVAIGEAYNQGDDYQGLAAETVDRLYGYDQGTVLFKPTKAASEQFRLSEAEAVSYFVGGVVPEDHGFAIQPWRAVRFENAGIILDCESAVAMGNYYFTDDQTGEEAKAEYTFGYHQDEAGEVVISLHHSSFPYLPTN